jgi:hypothetical protein
MRDVIAIYSNRYGLIIRACPPGCYKFRGGESIGNSRICNIPKLLSGSRCIGNVDSVVTVEGH